jgi:hypothetical protein
MTPEKLIEHIMLSFVELDAVKINQSTTLFSYHGDTEYHVFFYTRGYEEAYFSAKSLSHVVKQSLDWFNGPSKTMIPTK